MTFEEEEKEAIAARQRKLALKAALKSAPRAVRRAVSAPDIKPKAIIVTRNRDPFDKRGWQSWGQTNH